MKTLTILCLVFQFSLIWAQTNENDFENQKGALTCPLIKDELKNEQVVSVYDGEVVAVMYNKGFKNAVLIKHGDYFTVYSGLEKTNLSKGELVTEKQEIGNVSMKDGSKFHFEIWKGTEKLNSENWLACQN